MCLRVNTAKPAPIKNFSVWKCIQITDAGQLETPIRQTPICAGEFLPAIPFAKEIHHGMVIDCGVIHAYATATTAESRRDSNRIVIRCVVKPSEFVAWGAAGDVGVTKLRISRKTIANALKKQAVWLRKDFDRARSLLVVKYTSDNRRLQKAKRKLK